MMLLWLILLPVIGGVAAWAVAGRGGWASRATAIAFLVADVALWAAGFTIPPAGGTGDWIVRLDWAWIPRFGIGFDLAIDGLGQVMVGLALVLGIAAIAATATERHARMGLLNLALMWTLAGAIGVFLAVDLFLFFLFWEAMLVPMYFVIAVWGHEARWRAAIKFVLFTQGGGLVLLAAILGLALSHGAATGALTFGYDALRHATVPAALAPWLFAGFVAAFAVKLPVVPLHSWLPDAHTEAPAAGSVILAGVLLKTGAYGLIRFAVPLFPAVAHRSAPILLALAVFSILYGAVQAFAQTDAKRLVAYSSVAHMGFVMLGIFAWTETALDGAVMQMVAHGISTGALFILVGALGARLGTREMGEMGGLAGRMPRLAALGLVFAIASLGLPGLANFMGEFLVLLGTYRAHPLAAGMAAVGLVFSVVYATAFVARIFQGRPSGAAAAGSGPADFGLRPVAAMGALVAASLWLGLVPQPVLDTLSPALRALGTATGAG